MTSSPAITSVVFDFGGVIITTITEKIQRIADSLGCPMPQLHSIMMGPQHESGDHPWHRMERGEVARDDLQGLIAPIAAAEGVHFQGNEFETLLLNSTYNINHYVLDHIAGLKERGYKTGLLTNGMREFHDHLVTIVPEELFDVYIDSALVGMRKPEPRIFEHTLQELGIINPAEVVFLDDFMGNIEGARAAGMQVIHVGDPRVALEELEAMLHA